MKSKKSTDILFESFKKQSKSVKLNKVIGGYAPEITPGTATPTQHPTEGSDTVYVGADNV